MKHSIFSTSLAAALLLAPVLVTAQAQDTAPKRPAQGQQPGQGPGGGMMMPGGMMRPGAQGQMGMGMMQRQQDLRKTLRESLGLTDPQKAELVKVRETAQRDRLRKSTDLKIAGMDLKSLLRAEKVDEKAVAAKLAEMQAAQGALMKIRVDGALALKRILTPEQQKKIAAMRGQRPAMRQRMQQRMKRPGPMGAGQGRGRMGRPGAGPGVGPQGPGNDDDDEFGDDFGLFDLLDGGPVDVGPDGVSVR